MRPRRADPVTPDEYRRAIAREESEDDLLTDFLNLAALLGWLRYHVRNSRRGIIQGDVGFPDCVLVRPPRLLAVELKRDGAEPTRSQVSWLEALAGSGAETYVLRPSDWVSGRIEGILR